jgi:hypothetical protein
MSAVMDRYLNRVLAVADLRDGAAEARVREELRDHLEQKAAALREEGLSEAEALLKAVEDHGNPVTIGYKLRPWRWVDVRTRGTARGFIAIGPRARGVIAIGGGAIGVFACGGCALGVFSFGGVALGALAAYGGVAMGALAFGGIALGLLAFGGMAFGVIAAGGAAAGVWVPGAGDVIASHFTWADAPQRWRAIGEWLSFNPNSVAERKEFFRMLGIVNWFTVGMIVLFSIAQSMTMARELKRLRGVDPKIFE